MKLKGNRLKLRSGKVIQFRSARARANFERMAQAYRHGWRPTKKRRRRRKRG